MSDLVSQLPQKLPLFFAVSDQTNDSLVPKTFERLDLSIKSNAESLFVSDMLGNQLNRDRIARFFVNGRIHGPHSSTTECFSDPIRSQEFEWRHGDERELGRMMKFYSKRSAQHRHRAAGIWLWGQIRLPNNTRLCLRCRR